MKTGIISDTHIRKDYDSIDKLLSDHFNDMEVIIHLGDFSPNHYNMIC